MTYKPLAFGGLAARLPIIQGGMGVGVSLAGLAGAVAAAGGVGVISAAQIGFMERDFARDPVAANLRALGEQIRLAKERARGGVVGVNIMVAMNNYEKYVKAAVEAGVDLIVSGAGLPGSLPELVEGMKVAIAPMVSSAKGARVLLSRWAQKYARRADLLVVEGPKAGGHLGFTSDYFDKPHGENEYDAELAAIIEEADGVPVVFGGGVFDGADVRKYLDMGCAGVQVATRFVVTEECDAHQNFKDAYINAGEGDIALVKSPVGMPGRAIANDFLRRVGLGERPPFDRCYGCLRKCNPLTIPFCITDALVRSVRGDTVNGLIFCGANAYRVDRMTTVPELLEELCP